MLAGAGPRQHQVGQVRARNQQHQTRDGQQEPQRRVVLRPKPTDAPRSRIRPQSETLVSLDYVCAVSSDRRCLEDTRTDCVQPRGSALQRPSRAQASHHRHVENIAPQFLRLTKRDRNIKAVAYRQAEKPRRCHPDHFLQPVVDHECAAGADVASAHLALPVCITDYRLGRRACSPFILRQDRAPAPGPDSEHGGKTRR